jgi:hypothetical protein
MHVIVFLFTFLGPRVNSRVPTLIFGKIESNRLNGISISRPEDPYVQTSTNYLRTVSGGVIDGEVILHFKWKMSNESTYLKVYDPHGVLFDTLIYPNLNSGV